MRVCCSALLRLMASGLLDVDREPSAVRDEFLTVLRCQGDVFEYCPFCGEHIDFRFDTDEEMC